MPALAAADVLEAAAYCRIPNSQNTINVLHWRVVSIVGGATDITALAAPLSVFLGAAYDEILTISSSYRGCKLRRISPNPTQVYDGAGPIEVGLRNGDTLPGDTAPVVSLRSAAAPPRIRGRVFLPPPTEADQLDAGSLGLDYRADALEWANAVMKDTFVLTVGGVDVTLKGVIYAPSVPATYDVDTCIVRTFLCSQNRRRASARPDPLPF